VRPILADASARERRVAGIGERLAREATAGAGQRSNSSAVQHQNQPHEEMRGAFALLAICTVFKR
jgi:hypothetical protein